jgi:hypothetical protein
MVSFMRDINHLFFTLFTSNKVLFKGFYVKEPFFLTVLLSNFFKFTYLNHLKFNYNLFTSSYDIRYLFIYLVLLLEIVRSDNDAIKHHKII